MSDLSKKWSVMKVASLEWSVRLMSLLRVVCPVDERGEGCLP